MAHISLWWWWATEYDTFLKFPILATFLKYLCLASILIHQQVIKGPVLWRTEQNQRRLVFSGAHKLPVSASCYMNDVITVTITVFHSERWNQIIKTTFEWNWFDRYWQVSWRWNSTAFVMCSSSTLLSELCIQTDITSKMIPLFTIGHCGIPKYHYLVQLTTNYYLRL